MKATDVADLLAVLRRYGVSHYETKEITVDLQPSNSEELVLLAPGEKPDENLPFNQLEARRQREQVAYHSSE